MTRWTAHSTAIVETTDVGGGTQIWAYAHVMEGSRVGSRCTIGDHAFVEGGAVIGNEVTVKNGVMVWDGVTIGDGAFIGPGVVFTNDRLPRSPRYTSPDIVMRRARGSFRRSSARAQASEPARSSARESR